DANRELNRQNPLDAAGELRDRRVDDHLVTAIQLTNRPKLKAADTVSMVCGCQAPRERFCASPHGAVIRGCAAASTAGAALRAQANGSGRGFCQNRSEVGTVA